MIDYERLMRPVNRLASYGLTCGEQDLEGDEKPEYYLPDFAPQMIPIKKFKRLAWVIKKQTPGLKQSASLVILARRLGFKNYIDFLKSNRTWAPATERKMKKGDSKKPIVSP